MYLVASIAHSSIYFDYDTTNYEYISPITYNKVASVVKQGDRPDPNAS